MAVSKVATAALVLLALASCASAAVLQWDFPSELNLPGGKYAPMTISLGQSVTFNWEGTHGVYQLANGPGVGCPTSYAMSGPAVVGPVANGGSWTFSPTSVGLFNFACQVGNHCQDGMLIEISVVSGAPGPAPTMAPSMAPSTAMA